MRFSTEINWFLRRLRTLKPRFARETVERESRESLPEFLKSRPESVESRPKSLGSRSKSLASRPESVGTRCEPVRTGIKQLKA
jgi:hypothetical protein